MRRFAALPLSALLVSLLVPQAAASSAPADQRASVPVQVVQAETVHRAKPPKPAMSVAARHEQVEQDLPKVGHGFDLTKANSATGNEKSAAPAVDWSISNERYAPFRKPAFTVWGDAIVDFSGPVVANSWTVDMAVVDVASGQEISLPSQPLFCGGACRTAAIWSDTLGAGLTPGRLYKGKFRVRNSSTSSPWFTLSQSQPALFTPGIPGDLAGQCACNAGSQAYRGDPVNTATGAFVESFTDVQGTGPGVPLQVSRFYSSLSTAVSSFGKGWSWAYDSSLTASASEVAVRFADGATIKFTKDAGGAWQSPAAVKQRLRPVGTGWELRTSDGTTYRYDAAGLLTGIVDAGGIGVALAYSGGKLATVTERSGRVATLTWDADRIAKLSLSDGREVSYGYTSGLLTQVTDVRGQATSYGYDASGRIVTVTDALGRQTTKNTYDATTGRVSSQTNATGDVTGFEWDEARGESDTIDPNGGVWTDLYSGGVLVAHYGPDGRRTTYDYDGRLNKVLITDPRFAETVMTYDARDNMLTRTASAPLSYVESWTYDDEDNITSATDGRGQKTILTYDTANRLMSSTDPGGGKTELTYTAVGQLATQKTPAGHVTTMDYDTAGNLIAKTSPLGFVERLEYDAAGRVIASRDPRGSVEGSTPEEYTTHFTYDAAGNILTTTAPDDAVTTNVYDEVGKLSSATVANAGGTVLSATGYRYDAAGRTVETSDAAGVTSTTKFDSRGNRSESTDATGAKTTYSYDSMNRTASMTTPRGYETGADPAAFTWSYTYDANGNQLTSTDGAGRQTKQTFDVLNRVSTVTAPGGGVTTTTYDGAGNVLTSKDPLGRITTNVYDAAGRLQSTAVPGLQPTTYTYDLDGHQLSMKSPSGGSVTTWTYDADGRQITQTDPRGNVSGGTPADYTTTYGYDPAGNQTTQTDKLGKVTTQAYDPSNNVTSERDPLGNTTSYAYDALQRLTSVTSPVASATTTYTYDSVGNLAERKDPRDGVTKYGYNPRGDLTSVIDPLDRKQTFGYDAEGNVTEIIKARGYASGDLPAYTIRQAYDLRGLRTSLTTASTAANATFGYDADGLLKTYTDVTGTTTLTRDTAGQLTGVTQPQGNYGYTYTPYGEVLTRTQPGSVTSTYGYDTDGRATTLTSDGQTTGFGYDADSHLTSIVYPATSGYTQTRTYDRTGDIAAVANQKSGATTPLSRYDYTRDANHNPTVVKRTRGTTVYNEAFEYDAANRITKNCLDATTCTGAAASVGYSYDASGNRLTEDRAGVTNPGTTAYSYDAANQIINRTDPGGTVTPYSYNADGQLEGNRTWDVLGRITTETTGTQTTSFTYDALGLRRTVANTAGTKKLSWDINNPIPMIGVETRTDASLWRHRYAPDGTAVYVEHPAKTYPRSLLFGDALGSITDVLDQTGGARWRYGYEPFGAKRTTEKLNTTAEDPSLGFTGAYLEPTTGNYHVRARDLDPSGTFLSPDPLAPDLADPYVTAYAYANQQPTLLTDPTGLTPKSLGDFWDGLKAVGKKLGEVGRTEPQTRGRQIAVGIGGGAASLGDIRLGGGQTDLSRSTYYGWTADHLGVDGTEGGAILGELIFASMPIPGAGAAGVGTACRAAELARLGLMPTDAARALKIATEAARSGAGADNVVNGLRLAQQLARESASSAFTGSGKLNPGAISGANLIIPGNKLGNKALIQRLTADGSDIADWGKYTSRTYQSLSGNFQVHFYMNRRTGAVDYGYDYKVIFNGVPR
ncbi:RHS repeat protein [Kribbella capetownensis]|uniref:RHS repeat protein n=1 Tax=Kribbella capetownensis TaxID=1572659 RepID=A0A4V2M7V8_9ACTN|nr:DUF6531 domain-containing protein [Kribbella capetownensis]TCC48812.1 RHS repeat protein [Kribbella capetownensis]